MHPGYPYVSLQLREGNSFTGLILIDKKTDYREAIGVTLKENLKKDSVYIFEVSLAYPVLSRFSGGNLDIILSEKRIYVQNRTKKVNLPASISIPIDTVPTNGTWSTFHVEYKAKGYERFLSIGNFKPKMKTIYTQIEGRKKGIYRRFYNELYIAIDDVRLFPKYPLKTPQIEDLDVPLPVKKETLVIKGIRFRSASAEIENTEIPDLDRLVQVMNENSRIRIRITGHTDNVGDSFLNQELSLNRAKSVQEYLRAKGIDEARVQVAGKGDTQPVASNETESGRTQNRRIEVEILEQ
ncbi:MAG: OmpA family protein [Crocinitomicaceae bacterium]|nr:OmpA family protein [Crocinitomicaceae bacterium]